MGEKTKVIPEAQIRKELISLKTYPFSDPSPVPEFGRLYPYNRFDGYSLSGTDRLWEMVVMENDFIKLWINPDVGGKVWGAIEKSTGKEFIYFNHSAKFRDVAMRGPWTSGGMETNMGIIGHTPSCSSSVDYAIRKNKDGSVSCFIGASDWPSRTSWRVEICLPKDAAYFLSRTWWYNNSPLEQSYYQWTNIGVKVSGNLEYVSPGYCYLGHTGKSSSWPTDEEGRQISFYDKNNFGEYKSYHTFGSYADFWGAYSHDDDFGIGHYASYDDKPGRKIWIWGLSRYGMIWEDLLTDNDGQYTELQSGRLFNQAVSSSSRTPFKHRSFLPYTMDMWDEYWFPVKQINGLTYGCPQLSFYMKDGRGRYKINLCANQPLQNTLKLKENNRDILTKDIHLQPMDTVSIPLPAGINIYQLKIFIDDLLIYDASELNRKLGRPVEIAKNYDYESVQGLWLQAKEWERQRFYANAVEKYESCLKQDPNYIPALNGLGSILLRQMHYKRALQLITLVLSIDTYNPESNYLYGLINDRLSKCTDAKDGFSIAAQSIEYRASSFTELAKIYIRERQFQRAQSYLEKALQYNTKNWQVLQFRIIIERLTGKDKKALIAANSLMDADPLNHLVRFEKYKLEHAEDKEIFCKGITGELPYETYIELAAFYYNLNLLDDAIEIVSFAPDYAMTELWKAFLFFQSGQADKSGFSLQKAASLPSELVFPHREEDVKVLEWAIQQHNSWKFKYYLALACEQMLRREKALQLLQSCREESDSYPFYLTRANLNKGLNESNRQNDLLKAYKLAPYEWRTSLFLSRYLSERNQWTKALAIIKEGYEKNTGNYYIALHLAKCLMYNNKFSDGIELMNSIYVLPNEGASEGRNIWRETHLHAVLNAIKGNDWEKAIYYIAQARIWPENMGIGKPYLVDERLEDFLEIYCRKQYNNKIDDLLESNIAAFRTDHPAVSYGSNDFLSILILYGLQKSTDAKKIMEQWVNQDSTTIAVRWCKAFIEGNWGKVDELSGEAEEPKETLPYEIYFEDREFLFVKELYRMGIISSKE